MTHDPQPKIGTLVASFAEASRRTGLSILKIKELVRAGQVKTYAPGVRPKVVMTSLIAFVENGGEVAQ